MEDKVQGNINKTHNVHSDLDRSKIVWKFIVILNMIPVKVFIFKAS